MCQQESSRMGGLDNRLPTQFCYDDIGPTSFNLVDCHWSSIVSHPWTRSRCNVPLAMSTFGTVVAGVGTFHAPLTSFGCAAILQASSAALVSGGGAVAGGIVGATVGGLSQ